MPRDEIARIECEGEINGFLEQKNISEKNRKRLEDLTHSTLPDIAALARLVLAVARVAPRQRRRPSILAQQAPDLLKWIIDSGRFSESDDEWAGDWFFEEPDAEQSWDEVNLWLYAENGGDCQEPGSGDEWLGDGDRSV